MSFRLSTARTITGALLAIAACSHMNAAGQTNGRLLGRWTAGRVSTIQYKNSFTGMHAPTSGTNFAYEFMPDGTYSFTGLMQNTAYNCTNSVFSHETGTYTVEGDTISTHPEKNPYRMTNNCAPSSNREAPGKIIPKTFRFRIVQQDSREKLDLVDTSDGGAQSFQRDK